VTEPSTVVRRAHWLGDRAVLVALVDGDHRAALVEALEIRFPDLAVRAGMESVLVESAEPTPHLLQDVREALTHVEPTNIPKQSGGRVVTIPVSYVGEDLDAVADRLGVTAADVVRAHQRQRWTVAMMGFAPGFGYLVPLDAPVLDWAGLARRDRPREQVPAGSVAIAAGMSAVYPAAMPGGWHLIGSTDRLLFDQRAETDPTILHPGDEVRFEGDAR